MSIERSSSGTAIPSLGAITAALTPFRAKLSDPELQAVSDYLALLLQWSKSINLTAIEDPIEILSRHFGESLFAASLLNLANSRLADVGTGAGFPGLALKIVAPGMDLALFESNKKKCAFLTEVTQQLKFSAVRIARGRYEEFTENSPPFDYVCSKALGDYHVLLPWARRMLKPGGRIVLWLGTDESIRIGRREEFFWDLPVPIPESRRRVILMGRTAGGPECFT